ncbi:MAG: SAM-dependent methyltransferase [Gemmatimonadaceae bacterium]
MTEIENVSDTAFWIANYRATETDRPDALFRDPLARKLAGERGREIANSMPGSKMTEWITAVRTVVIDDLIQQAIATGIDTILNLGAGLDTRPYRMTLPKNLRWIEVDFPPIIEYKEKQLAGETPHCQLERVKLDLRNRELRTEFLSSVNVQAQRVLVLTEGVVPYLSIDDAASLADDLKANANFESWIVDYFSRQVIAMRRRAGLRERMQNAPFQFDPPNWNEFFLNHGWRVGQMTYLSDEAMRRNRAVPLPAIAKLFYLVRSWFMSKEKLRVAMQFMGYARMERA